MTLPVGIPHAASEDIPYRDVVIPKGAILIPNIVSLSRSPAKYSKPDKFEPERFLHDDVDAATSARSSDFRERDHYHFGFGRRFCPGSHVAEAMVYIAIVRILWAFDIRAVRGLGLKMENQRSMPPTALDVLNWRDMKTDA